MYYRYEKCIKNFNEFKITNKIIFCTKYNLTRTHNMSSSINR